MKVKNEERIARIEAICEKIRNAEIDVQESVLRDAIAAEDEELAASITRTIRNKLLERSDGMLAFDRCGIELPDTVTASSMLQTFKALIDGLKTLLNGEWAEYRQALRNLPAQPGFPFNIVWPEMPENTVKNDNE